MVFSDYTKKGYCSTVLKARTLAHITRTYAHITRTLNRTLRFASLFFAPVPSASLVVLLYRSWLQHWIALNFSITHSRREALFEIRDKYLRCTRIKFNYNTRVVRTYVKRNGPHPCVVRSISVRSPFNSRLTSVFIKRSSVKRTVHGRFFLAHTVCDRI